MKRIIGLVFVAASCLFAAPESVERARELERGGQALDARAAFAQAVAEAPSDPETLLAYAEFLDRYADPDRTDAYRKALAAASGDEQKRRLSWRLAVLELLAGDGEAAQKAVDQFNQASGSGLAFNGVETNSTDENQGYGWTEVPGLLNSFLRMSALSTDLEPVDMMPALARNIVTGGYRSARGSESLQATEYLKLLTQYLTQAGELEQFAGANLTIDVPACESIETAQLLKILGYRLRNECGPNAVIETVNPSRAFLSIDSAFPLAELEEAYRREEEFHLPYQPTRLPVLYGPEYWSEASESKVEGSFIDRFIGDPAVSRLYVALAKMHRPTALALKERVPADRLKNYANVIDFFGESFEIIDGAAVLPGGQAAAATWRKLVGANPANGAEFFQALVELDDGWMGAYFDALSRTRGEAQRYFADPSRLERFYMALRGRVTSPGPARPIFRATGDLLLMTARVEFDSNAQPRVPGGLEVWRDLFVRHPHGTYDGKLTRSAERWSSADDLVEALFGLSRKAIEKQPLKMFLAISNIDRRRSQRLEPATVARMTLAFPKYGGLFSVLTGSPAISDKTIVAYLDVVEEIDDIGRPARKADMAGVFQALSSLWEILVRQGQIPTDKAGPTLDEVVGVFAEVRNEENLFDAGRRGALVLLRAAGSSIDAPQESFISLLAGSPGEGERGTHEEIVGRLNTLFNQQRLVSLKTLFDLADHLERVSRGESFNVAMANRLAATISEVRLPRSELSTEESNAFGRGGWVDTHIRDQRGLNLRRSVDKARGDPQQLLGIRGEIAPVLRDTLVGLVYVYYTPPGAELIRANPLFVRSHDFLGPDQARSWTRARVQGSGWPNSGGGRIIGSLASLPYALNDAEQNFMVPTERQALIWQDLAPQVLLGATVPKWWKVDPDDLHYVGLNLRLGNAILAAAALDSELRHDVLRRLRRRVEPARIWHALNHFEHGRAGDAVSQIAPAEVSELAISMMADNRDAALAVGPVFVEEIERLNTAVPAAERLDRIGRAFGVPHPDLAGTYLPEFLSLPLFPTMMGYSSRVLAESWESTNIYWAALADEAHLAPAELNLRIPEWTQGAIERIFATHLEDWPALMRSMRIVGDRYRLQMRARMQSQLQAAAQ